MRIEKAVELIKGATSDEQLVSIISLIEQEAIRSCIGISTSTETEDE